MFKYTALVFTGLKKAFLYKNGSATIFSLSFATILSSFEQAYEFEFLGISYSFIMLAVALIMTNFITGAIASRYEQEAKEGWFDSDKITYTVYKFLSIGLILWLATELHEGAFNGHEKTKNVFWKSIYGSALNTISIIRTTVLALICGREYLSIGDNIYRRFGKKYYAFSIFEKVFDVIELKFIKKIEKECEK